MQEADFILLGFTLVHFTDNHIFTNERSVTTWQPASLWAPFPQQLLLTSCLWVTCWQFSKYFECFHSQYPSLVGHVFLQLLLNIPSPLLMQTSYCLHIHSFPDLCTLLLSTAHYQTHVIEVTSDFLDKKLNGLVAVLSLLNFLRYLRIQVIL